jgi:hypothetical protein
VHIFAPDGHLIGRILFHRTANLCWGGPQYKTLYMTGQPLVTSLPVLVAGTPALKTLKSKLTGEELILSWPAPSTGFGLQETSEPAQSASWTNSSLPVITTNDEKKASVAPTNRTQFFRLRLN